MGAEILAERAMEPDVPYPGQGASRPRTSFSQDEPAARRIYGGTMPKPPESEGMHDQQQPSQNRRVANRKVSTFNIILMLMGTAILTVLYVGNIIAVDQLTKEIGVQQAALTKILNEQELLKATISQMSSLERVRTRAADEIGLRDPKEPPQWISVYSEKIRTLKEHSKRD